MELLISSCLPLAALLVLLASQLQVCNLSQTSNGLLVRYTNGITTHQSSKELDPDNKFIRGKTQRVPHDDGEEIRAIIIPSRFKRGTKNRKGNREFVRYKLKRRSKAEFVSLRCGIGAHWEASTKNCVPHRDESVEKEDRVPEDTDEEIENPAEKPRLSVPEEKSEEVVMGHIISVYCGMGFSYNKQGHKCTPLPPT